MSDNFINWLLGIGPNQFTPEQQTPSRPKESKDRDKNEADTTKPNDPNDSALGRPRG
jgi:hypothetical protein